MRPLPLILTVSGTLFLATLAFAGDQDCGITECPQCCHDCVLTVKTGKKTHSGYGVECKPICIPRVVFPWQKRDDTCDQNGCSLVHNGARTRTVHVLKKYEYKCSVCKYKWSPVDHKNSTNGCVH